MEIRQLQSFVAIAKLGGFRRAAEELNISQAARSQQMKLLETEAQVALFERGHRPLTLIGAGQALLEHAERILREASSARQDLQDFAGLERGHITVSTLAAHGAPFAVPLLGAFYEAHPHVSIEIVEYTAEANDLVIAGPLTNWWVAFAKVAQPSEEVRITAQFGKSLHVGKT